MGNSKQDQLKIYFRIDKDLIHTGDWAKLSKAAKSVYPVIGRHLNKRGETWVSLETIAREAGTTRQRASRGMKELKEMAFRKLCSNSMLGQAIRVVAI